MSEPFRLRAEEQSRLNESGFVVRENVFTRDECAAMADAVETLERDLLAAKRRTKVTVGSYMFELQRELGSIVKWEPDHPEVVQGIEPFAHISKPLDGWARDHGHTLLELAMSWLLARPTVASVIAGATKPEQAQANAAAAAAAWTLTDDDLREIDAVIDAARQPED